MRRLTAAGWIGAIAGVLSIAALIASVLIWLVRLEGRVNAQDLQLGNAAAQNQQIREDLQYIRQRLDDALDARGRR